MAANFECDNLQGSSLSRVTVLQFWEAAQQAARHVEFQSLQVLFTSATEIKSLASSHSLGTCVVAHSNVLLDICVGEQPSDTLTLLIVSDESNTRKLSLAQQKLLPVVIAAMVNSLFRAPPSIKFIHADFVTQECIEQLRQDMSDGRRVAAAVEQIRSGPFELLSRMELAIVAKLKKLFMDGARPQRIVDPINPSGKPNLNKQESMTMPSYEVMHASERGLFDAPPPIDPADHRELRKHVINLNFGKFSTAGEFATSLHDVNALFKQHLKEWISTQETDLPVRIVLYAHGGLTTEAWGLHTAAFQMKWWKQNGVYPIFFVWETGLVETLRQIFVSGQRRLPFDGTRGVVSDWFDELEDRGWEIATRRLGGPRVWGGMKESARLSFVEGGDGRVVLENLRSLAEEFKDRVEIHALGHSAGSIFLAYAMQAAKAMSLPKCESMHFLAPAITCQLFRDTLKPLVGNGVNNLVNSLSIFTMSDEYERKDTVGPYDKSLLYLITNALEPQSETPLLGLERSLVGEADMVKFFGLAGNQNNARTEIVFAITSPEAEPKKSCSLSKAHGDFDNDPATMESVLRRIIKARNTSSVRPFPVDRGLSNAARMLPLSSSGSVPANAPSAIPVSVANTSVSSAPCSGQRRALCIGIDAYPTRPLLGCVNDSNDWCNWLKTQEYTVTLLKDAQATRKAIIDSMRQIIDSSAVGDAIAIQFAGHGTQVPDLNGDEFQGDTPGKDEALVPYDYLQNGLVLDDDLGELCRNIKAGVNVTFFMDCCHSGTNTRMFMSNSISLAPNQRARFLPATPDMLEAHERSRNSPDLGMRAFTTPYKGTREILFAACRSNEYALETDGHGDFTRNAMAVLAQRVPLTVEQFYAAVLQRFGTSPRQTPGLWCDDGLRSLPLLGKVRVS